MSRWHLNLWVLIGSALWIIGCPRPFTAQVIPDNTLPVAERSQVIGNPNFQIDGGARRGGNLFHSFSQFSVPTGGTAYFNNAADIQNILTRVTGGSISNIDGLIRANGTANLFLLNPNGIIFGQNARLNIGGSFVASTASSLKFVNGFEFSATDPQSTPLLSVNVPIGLQYGVNPGAIQVKGDGQGLRSTNDLIDTTNALRVSANQTLALVGGDIFLEGATLKTAGGRIELGSVGDNSLVSLTPITKGFSLSYDGVQNFGNIQLSRFSAVDASGAGGGDIQVQSRRVTLSDASQIEASTLRTGKGGNLVVNATELVKLVGISADAQFPSGLYSFSYPGATGDAGNLTINTQHLLVQDGAHVTVSTYSSGKGGSLTVNASNVQIIGQSADGTSANLLANAYSTGNAGNLTLNTQHLLIQNGGQASATAFRAGKGGSLTVNANNVQLIGTGTTTGDPSGLFARTMRTGDAGNLTINTQHLLVQDGAQISASTFGAGKGGSLTVTANDVQLIGTSADGRFSSSLFADARSTGDAGNLTINTQHLLVRDGARVGDGTYGAGKGGSLTVTANDVQLIGTSADGQLSSGLYTRTELKSTGDAGNLTIQPPGNERSVTVRLQAGAQISASTSGRGRGGTLTITAPESITLTGNGSIISAETSGRGTGGNLNLQTGTLNIQNQAEVTVSSSGTGSAGSLFVDANRIYLDNQGSSRADTSGGGGDINLRSPLILLRNGSKITTNATGSNIPGGNIAIDTRFLVAVPRENSDISANSQDFRGGNVSINAYSIFGLQPRPQLTPLSDITATGANSAQSGTIQLNIERLDPAAGLGELPATVVDSSRLIARGCPATQGNSFVISGRGGLPPNPEQQLDDDADWQDRRRLVVARQKTQTGSDGSSQHSDGKIYTSHPPIIEATGWQMTPTGKVRLVATTPNPAVQNPLNQPVACNGRR